MELPSSWLESSWSSSKTVNTLIQLRTKEMKDPRRKQKLLKRGLVNK